MNSLSEYIQEKLIISKDTTLDKHGITSNVCCLIRIWGSDSQPKALKAIAVQLASVEFYEDYLTDTYIYYRQNNDTFEKSTHKCNKKFSKTSNGYIFTKDNFFTLTEFYLNKKDVKDFLDNFPFYDNDAVTKYVNDFFGVKFEDATGYINFRDHFNNDSNGKHYIKKLLDNFDE